MSRFRFTPAILMAFGALCAQILPAQTATLQGRVTDPSGAAIAGAAVTISTPAARPKTVSTDSRGAYRFDALPAAKWSVRIDFPGFAPFQIDEIELDGTSARTIDAQLQIRRDTDKITVADNNTAVSVDADRNAGQIVLHGDDLDSLSDDPEDLANELQMLAGPAPGPEGPQMFIDGFTGGRMPPKQSIREIRVNQNPFSSEYDRVGFGRIEVFTKPGSDHYHGQTSFDFSNRALTARNPFLAGPIVPDYQQEFIAGNLSGPLSKKASFFVDIDRRITDENSIVNYTAFDTAGNQSIVNGAVVAPSRRIGTNPRVDYALTPTNTVSLRYTWLENNARNQGVTTQSFDLPSRAYTLENTEQGIQLNDSAVLGEKAVNDAKLQLYFTRASQSGISSAPEIDVQGAFTAGGTYPLNYTHRNYSEYQDTLTLIHGAHTLKIGGRLREEWLKQQSTTNFNGRFVFSEAVYQQNQILSSQGISQSQIAALGYGPFEFLQTTGTP